MIDLGGDTHFVAGWPWLAFATINQQEPGVSTRQEPPICRSPLRGWSVPFLATGQLAYLQQQPPPETIRTMQMIRLSAL
jgi:hypothetical protein